MSEAYIIEAARTPVGRRSGGLSSVHPVDLGAHVLTSLLDDHVTVAGTDIHLEFLSLIHICRCRRRG